MIYNSSILAYPNEQYIRGSEPSRGHSDRIMAAASRVIVALVYAAVMMMMPMVCLVQGAEVAIETVEEIEGQMGETQKGPLPR